MREHGVGQDGRDAGAATTFRAAAKRRGRPRAFTAAALGHDGADGSSVTAALTPEVFGRLDDVTDPLDIDRRWSAYEVASAELDTKRRWINRRRRRQ